MIRQPTLYVPHGGGPCFFMKEPMGGAGTWDRMAEWLRGIEASLPEKPKALLVISGHWEERIPTVTTSPKPPLLYDYSGFPPETYQLEWAAPGSPELAKRVRGLLKEAGIESAADERRGFDHGVFIPLKVAWDSPTIPTIQLSLRAGLDPAEHLAIGRALAPLRDEGVLIVGSGMSYHNMRGFLSPQGHEASLQFDRWLSQAVSEDSATRDDALKAWSQAPAARASHPREEHLLPLMVVAGAAGGDRGRTVFSDEVLGVKVSAVRFG